MNDEPSTSIFMLAYMLLSFFPPPVAQLYHIHTQTLTFHCRSTWEGHTQWLSSHLPQTWLQ